MVDVIDIYPARALGLLLTDGVPHFLAHRTGPLTKTDVTRKRKKQFGWEQRRGLRMPF